VLAAQLGTFRDHPSIFASAPVPEQATKPFILLQSVTDVNLETKNRTVREITEDIGIYDDEDGSAADVEFIAEYLREKLRTPFTVPDWTMSALSLSGPMLNDSDEYHGRILTARIVLDR
jgi:hypothetical protein